MRITWIRAGDRYPDLKDDLDHFLALDGERRDRPREVGRDRAGSRLVLVDDARAPGSGLQPADMGAMRDARAGGPRAGRLLQRVPGVLRDRGIGRGRVT